MIFNLTLTNKSINSKPKKMTVTTSVYSPSWWARAKKNADMLGISIEKSNRIGKKLYAWLPMRKKWGIHFGSSFSSDYLAHQDEKRRTDYFARHSKIFTKKGERAIDIPMSPAWLSARILWS